MTTTSYLLSGVTLASTGTLYVGGMDRFTVSLHGANNGTDTPTGTLFLYGRLHTEMPYATIITNNFSGSGSADNIISQFNGPFESLQGVLAPLNSPLTGIYSIVCATTKVK